MTDVTRTSLRAALAALLAIAASPLVTAQRPYWMILIAVVVVNDTWGSSLRKTWQRIGMTGAGCIAGWALHYVSDGHLSWERALLLLAVFFAAFFRKSSYPWMTFFITVYVAFLITVLGQWSVSLMAARLEDTVLGGVIAILASLLIPAPRVRLRVEEQMTAFWQNCRAQVEQGFEILQSGEDPDDNWREGRRELLRKVEQAQVWARETDYETFLKYRSWRRGQRVFRNTVMLCHQTLGFNRVARLAESPADNLDEIRSETLRKFDLLFSPKTEEVQLTSVPWPETTREPVAYFGCRIDELLAEIYRDL